MSKRVRFIATVLGTLAVVATPGILLAHARLVRSAPAGNATLVASPKSLELWFSERPELKFTTVELLDSSGVSIPLGAVARISGDAMGLSAAIPATLANGRYTVSWRTAAADGHPSSGKFAFVVAAPDAPAATPQADTVRRAPASVPHTVVAPAPTATVSTAVRWADLVAVLALIGAIIFGAVVLPRATLRRDVARDAEDRARRFGNAALVLFVVTTLWRLSAQADLIPSAATARLAAMLSVVRETAWGAGWLAGAAGVAIVAVGLALSRSGSFGWIVAIIGSIGIAASEGLTGHAGASTHAAIASVADTAHVLAAAGWLGGLAAVAACGLAATRRAEQGRSTAMSHQLVRAFHRTAVECVIVVLVTAAIAVYLRLNAVSDLWTSTYGRVLLWKLAFAAALLAFGWFHWRTAVVPEWSDDTRFRFRRSVAFELLVGAGIVAVTAVLVTTALPGS